MLSQDPDLEIESVAQATTGPGSDPPRASLRRPYYSDCLGVQTVEDKTSSGRSLQSILLGTVSQFSRCLKSQVERQMQ